MHRHQGQPRRRQQRQCEHSFQQAGKDGKFRDFSLQHLHLRADETFDGLLRLARDFSHDRQFRPQHINNTTHGMIKLHAAGEMDVTESDVDDTLTALEAGGLQLAPELVPQGLSMFVCSFAKFWGGS